MEQVSEHIWSIKSWMLIPVHVWLVSDETGVTLVDAGFPFMASGILKCIDRLNAGPLQRILLTHGHSDHVGSLRRILNSKSVRVYAHRIELPYMEGQLRYPRRKKLEFNVAKGLVQPLGEEQDGRLAMVAGLQPHLTPGHAPGHVVYYHEQDQVLIAGDLCTSKGGRLYRPMPIFTADMAEVLRSTAIVKQLIPRRLEVCHGEPVFNPADHVDNYITATAASFSIPRAVLD